MIDDAVEALKLKKPEPEVPKKKAETYTVRSSGVFCDECLFPLGGGPSSCISCDQIAADAMTPISRVQSSTRLKHRPTRDGWKHVGKSTSNW
jgi:hypothetical protein